MREITNGFFGENKDWVITVFDNKSNDVSCIYHFLGTEEEIKEKLLHLVIKHRFEKPQLWKCGTEKIEDVEYEEGKYVAYAKFTDIEYSFKSFSSKDILSFDNVHISEDNPKLGNLFADELTEYIEKFKNKAKIEEIYNNSADLAKSYLKNICVDAFIIDSVDIPILAKKLIETNNEYFQLKTGRILKFHS